MRDWGQTVFIIDVLLLMELDEKFEISQKIIVKWAHSTDAKN